jgi:hypothetical protein
MRKLFKLIARVIAIILVVIAIMILFDAVYIGVTDAPATGPHQGPFQAFFESSEIAALKYISRLFGKTWLTGLFVAGFILVLAAMFDPEVVQEALAIIGEAVGAVASGVVQAVTATVESVATSSGFIGVVLVGIAAYFGFKVLTDESTSDNISIHTTENPHTR